MPRQRSIIKKVGDKEVYQTRTSEASGPDAKWYTVPRPSIHLQLFPYIRQLKNKQAMRRYELAIHCKAYSNFQWVGFNSSLFGASTRGSAFRVSVNVIKSCVDTATARIAQNKPRVYLLPNEGDFDLEQRAGNLQKFLDGQFDAANVYDNSQEVFRDSCIYGNGALYLFEEGGEIKSQQLKIDELLVDDVDAMYGDPQMMYREHWVPRDKLIKKYPAFESEIRSAHTNLRGETGFSSRSDHVIVIEAWRKPSEIDGDDGVHALCIQNATLFSEAWTKDYIPIVSYAWTPALYGFWGQGIALELEGLQLSINETMRNIQKSLRLFAIPRVFVDAQAQVSQQMINDISINQYSGTPPVFITPPAMASDVYSYLQWLYQLAFQQIGISQMSAQSQKPQGLDSAIAMRTYQNVENQRFAIQGQRWNSFFIRVGKIIIDMSKELYTRNKKLSVKVPGRRFMERIDWSQVNMKADQYVMQCWPTNLLPIEPEGRLAAAQEAANSGLMPREVIISQLNMPVLNDWIDDETAARDNIKMCLTKIMKDGRYISPEPIQNLQLAVSLSQAAILRAECNDSDPARIDLLRRFLNESLSLSQARQPQEATAPNGAPTVGQAPPPPAAPLAAAGSGPVQAAAQ